MIFKRNLACVSWQLLQFFFFRNKLSPLEHVLFLQVFSHKSLSTATFERKLSSVSLPLEMTITYKAIYISTSSLWYCLKLTSLTNMECRISQSFGNEGWKRVLSTTVSRRPCYCRLIEKACHRLAKLESEGCESYDAWNQTTVDLVKAAKVWLRVKLDLLDCLSMIG